MNTLLLHHRFHDVATSVFSGNTDNCGVSSKRDNIVRDICSASEEKVFMRDLNNRHRGFWGYSIHLAPYIPVENQVSDNKNLPFLEYLKDLTVCHDSVVN